MSNLSMVIMFKKIKTAVRTDDDFSADPTGMVAGATSSALRSEELASNLFAHFV